MAFGSAAELATHQKLHSSILHNTFSQNGALSKTAELGTQSSGQPSQGLISDQSSNLASGFKMAQLALSNDDTAHIEDDKPVQENGKVHNAEPDLDMEKLMKIVNKPFKCSECGKAFVSTTELAGHVRIHTGERPFKCSQCDNCYRTQSTLAVHMKSHNRDKRYKCTYCEETCPTLSKLYDHYMIHQGWQPNDRRAQEEKITKKDDEPLKCWVCQRGFSEQTDLEHHISLHKDRSKTLELCIKKLKSSMGEK